MFKTSCVTKYQKIFHDIMIENNENPEHNPHGSGRPPTRLDCFKDSERCYSRNEIFEWILGSEEFSNYVESLEGTTQ